MVTQKLVKSINESTGLLLTSMYMTISSFNEHLKSKTAEGLYVKNPVDQNALQKCSQHDLLLNSGMGMLLNWLAFGDPF